MGKHSNNKRIIGIKNCSEKYKKECMANENNALNRESQLNSHNCLINSKEDHRDLNSYFKRNKVNFRRNNAYSFTVILFISLLLFISNQNTMVFASESSSCHSSTYSCEESYKNLETNSDFIQIKEFYEKSLETMKSQIEELEDNNRDLKAQLQVCNSNQQQMYQGYNPQTHTAQDEQEIDSSKLYKPDDVLDYWKINVFRKKHNLEPIDKNGTLSLIPFGVGHNWDARNTQFVNDLLANLEITKTNKTWPEVRVFEFGQFGDMTLRESKVYFKKISPVYTRRFKYNSLHIDDRYGGNSPISLNEEIPRYLSKVSKEFLIYNTIFTKEQFENTIKSSAHLELLVIGNNQIPFDGEFDFRSKTPYRIRRLCLGNLSAFNKDYITLFELILKAINRSSLKYSLKRIGVKGSSIPIEYATEAMKSYGLSHIELVDDYLI